MPVTIDGRTYYRTVEVCRLVGVSRTTLFRWLKRGSLTEAKFRDRRGWRLFTEKELNKMKAEANLVTDITQSSVETASRRRTGLEVEDEKR